MSLINEIAPPEKLERSFGGKTENFKSKEEQRFEQKHLKAYLRGDKTFKYGFDKNGDPIFYKVKEIWS